MPAALADFHFLRPEWLWLAVPAVLVVFLVHWHEDVLRPWRGLVAPHLLPHLLVGRARGFRLRPVHCAAAFLFLATFALAGPSWQREASPFAQEQAALVVALDLSRSMDAIDVSPTRLERGKQKIRDLLRLRQGARTALIAYAGTAHLVLPLTDDAKILESYALALATNVMPTPGKDAAAALKLADRLLAQEPVPGTVLFVTDGIPKEQAPAFLARRAKNPRPVVVLGVGTSEGGPIRDGKGFLTEQGARVVAKLDREGLEALARDAGAFVATATLDDRDVTRIQRGIESHLASVVQKDEHARFRDAGWYLCPFLALMGGLWFRRGFAIRWASVLLLGALVGPARVEAGEWRFADLWATRDQQAHRLFERGDWKSAAERFQDPMWKGVACYRAADYACAKGAFARVDSPAAWFNLGNAQARAGEPKLALEAYDKALAQRPGWPEAKANRDLVAALVPRESKEYEKAGPADPNQPPDEVKLDEKAMKGKAGKVEVKELTDEEIARIWLRGVETSPADFLRSKFALQARETKDGGGKGGAPR
jgi:Ca-activated chloride channel homolog